jgi:hypothetical protein
MSAGLSASVDARIAAVGARVADSVVGDIDARLGALGEEVQLQLKELSGQLSALSSGKADASALTQYTSQVTQVFEQLAGTVVSSSQESMQELQAQVQQVRAAGPGATHAVTGGAGTSAHRCMMAWTQQSCIMGPARAAAKLLQRLLIFMSIGFGDP